MHPYNFLRKNDGFLLISTYFVIFILIVLAAVFFSQAVNEHSFTKKSLAGMEAKYNAEGGIDYVLTEIKYNSSFLTHIAAESPAGSGNYILTPASSSPAPQLSNVAIIDDNYASTTGKFIVKVYRDPISASDEIVILAKGIHEEASRLFVAKYVPSSLYRFFIFTPNEFSFGSKTYDAGGGSIHANQNFIFSGKANISNVTEMSTGQYLRYSVTGYVPEGNAPIDGTPWDEIFYRWRDPWYTPNNNYTEDPSYDYLNTPDGRNTGNKSRLLMSDGSGGYITWDGNLGTLLDPRIPANYAAYAAYTAINGVTIPNYFSGAVWPWNMYGQLSGSGYAGYTYDPVMWDVDYFNTQYQSAEWIDFLNTEGSALQDIVMDINTGGSFIAPLSIDGGGTYKVAAEQGGIYIDYDDDTHEIHVTLNGTELTWSGDEIEINSETVFATTGFWDVNTAEYKEAIICNIRALMDANGINGGLSQQIIYSDYPLMLSEAEYIFGDGLTTVCQENIYLHGQYNRNLATIMDFDFMIEYPYEQYPQYYTTPASAAITAKFNYTLSDHFDFPQTLPATFHNPNYPYVDDYIPGVQNWYAEHEAEMANQVNTIPPGFSSYLPYIYNIALVGANGYQPMTLERWRYYTTPGDLNNPPGTGGSWISAWRMVNGAFIQLEDNDFSYTGALDNVTARWCSDPRFPAGYCREAQYQGWPDNMGAINPTTDYYGYNVEFAAGHVPPGNLVGFSATVFLEIANTEENWDQHYEAISSPQT